MPRKKHEYVKFHIFLFVFGLFLLSLNSAQGVEAVQDCLDDWLANANLRIGLNGEAQSNIRVVYTGTANVSIDRQSRQFLEFRQSAFRMAEIEALGRFSNSALQTMTTDNGQSTINSASNLRGFITAHYCEDWNDVSSYTVGVVVMSTNITMNIARALLDSSVRLPPSQPQAPLRDQLNALGQRDPNWPALAIGVRLYINERGERVVVGFGAAAATSNQVRDKELARIRALTAIRRFAGQNFTDRSTESTCNSQENSTRRTVIEDTLEYRQSETIEFTERSGISRIKISRVNGENCFESLQEVYLARFNNLDTAEILAWRGQYPGQDLAMQVIGQALTLVPRITPPR